MARLQRARPLRGARRAQPAPRARASSWRSSRRNLDEFFQVRVSGLLDQVAAGQRQAVPGRPHGRRAAGRDPRPRPRPGPRARADSWPRCAPRWPPRAWRSSTMRAIPEHHARLRRALPRRDLPGPDAARRRPRATRSRTSARFSLSLAVVGPRPRRRRAALRPRQGPADPAAPRRRGRPTPTSRWSR